MIRVSWRSIQWAAVLSMAWIAGAELPINPCFADPVLFDPDGSASANSPITIGGLDWSVGNAVAIGGNQAVANFEAGSGSTTFEVDYQAVLAGYIDTNGNTIAPSGINTSGGFEITVAARFFEQVVNVSQSGTTATASFVQAPNQTGSFFEIWYDSNPNASNLNGTGFRDGTNILSATVTGATGNYTVTNTSTSAAGIFDGFGPDNFNGLKSVPGIGASKVSFNVVPGSVNTSFFLTPLTAVSFNTTNRLPFNQTDPSKQFFGYTPSLGSINGALPIAPSGSGGKDVQFESDGNNSFAVVPEPSSAVLILLGVASLIGVERSRRRHRLAFRT